MNLFGLCVKYFAPKKNDIISFLGPHETKSKGQLNGQDLGLGQYGNESPLNQCSMKVKDFHLFSSYFSFFGVMKVVGGMQAKVIHFFNVIIMIFGDCFVFKCIW